MCSSNPYSAQNWLQQASCNILIPYSTHMLANADASMWEQHGEAWSRDDVVFGSVP